MAILRRLNNFIRTVPQVVTSNGIKLAVNNEMRKSLWGYVAIAFNRVDYDRLAKVGPDRMCAEWLLKNGGALRTIEVPNRLLRDYNSLPPENVRFRIKEVDATGSSIMKIGLEHFKGCNFIDNIIFHNCQHLEEDGLKGLLNLRNSLKVLQVSACNNILDEGLMVIGKLTNLEYLKIFEMRYVVNLEKVRTNLRAMLPNCEIDIK